MSGAGARVSAALCKELDRDGVVVAGPCFTFYFHGSGQAPHDLGAVVRPADVRSDGDEWATRQIGMMSAWMASLIRLALTRTRRLGRRLPPLLTQSARFSSASAYGN